MRSVRVGPLWKSTASTASPPAAQSLPLESRARTTHALTSPAMPSVAAHGTPSTSGLRQPTTDMGACARPGRTMVVYGEPKIGIWS